jgi:hypothetical protein
MWWTDGNGYFHQGDPGPGERAATDEEVAAYLASRVTLDLVDVECARRISLIVSLDQKLDMIGTMLVEVMAVAILGQPATDAQKTDAASFIASMQWIAAMRGACAGLVGNLAYDQDASWPALPSGLAAFGARF